MNEEYLWDKTGEDLEIERLETLLGEFRYKKTTAPALPAKVLPFQTNVAEKSPSQTSRRRFSKNFAFAACAAAILLAFGIFLQFRFNQTASVNDLAKTAAQINDDAQQSSIDAAEKLSTERAETAQQLETSKATPKPANKFSARLAADRSSGKTRRIGAKVLPKIETVARRTEIKKPDNALTAEEKNAYDQLLLALSITSEKLNIVKNKIDGNE